MQLVKVNASSFDNLKRRLIKFLRYGGKDVQNVQHTSPYGVDHNPVKDLTAIYAVTGNNGKAFIIGYLLPNQKADVGELRLYSTDADGNLKFETWIKNDGTMQLGGTADNSVRYSPLNTAASQLAQDINVELGKIATGIAAAGGSYTPGNISIDISGAKINEIKTL